MTLRATALLAMAALLACSPASPLAPDLPARVAPSRSGQAAYRALPPPRTTVVHTTCTERPVVSPQTRTIHDFEPIPLEPVITGPRIEHMPRTGHPRALPAVITAIERHTALVNQCYRWARSRAPELETTLTLRAVIDPWGKASELAVTTATDASPDARDLAACVADVLAGMRVSDLTPRLTRVSLPLVFRAADERERQAHDTTPVMTARPRAGEDHPVPAPCIQHEPDMPVDDLSASQPVLAFDDLDRTRPAPGRPVIKVGCPMVIARLPRDTLLRGVGYNLGGYQACYSDAVAAQPDLAHAGHALDVRMHVDPSGSVHDVAIDPHPGRDAAAGLPEELITCVAEATRALWFHPAPRHRVELRVPFLLAPPRERTGHGPEALLGAGHADAALRGYEAALARDPDAPAACTWRAGVLEAVLMLEPWLARAPDAAGSPRLVAAAGALAAALRARSDTDPGRRCHLAAAPILRRLAIEHHKLSQRLGSDGLLEAALAWYRWILHSVPAMPDRAELAYYMADAAHALGQHELAAEAYYESIELEPRGKHAADARQGLDQLLAAMQRAEHVPPLARERCVPPP